MLALRTGKHLGFQSPLNLNLKVRLALSASLQYLLLLNSPPLPHVLVDTVKGFREGFHRHGIALPCQPRPEIESNDVRPG